MLETLDYAAVRRFTDEMKDRLRRCDNGEGMLCSTLEETIGHYVKLCTDIRDAIGQWAKAVFSGQIAFDDRVEKLLQDEALQILGRTKHVAAYARVYFEDCFELEKLKDLHECLGVCVFYLGDFTPAGLGALPRGRPIVCRC